MGMGMGAGMGMPGRMGQPQVPGMGPGMSNATTLASMQSGMPNTAAAMQGMNMVDLVCPALRVEHIDDVLADLDREATGAVILSSEVLVHGESAGPGCKITGDE